MSFRHRSNRQARSWALGVILAAGVVATAALGTFVVRAPQAAQEEPTRVAEGGLVANPRAAEAGDAELTMAGEEGVSAEAMEEAIAAYLGCIDEAEGIVIHAVYPGEGLRLTKWETFVPAEGPGDTAGLASANEAYTSCWEQHLDKLDPAWASQIQPTTEDIEGMYRWMEVCVATGGIPRHGEVPQFAITMRDYGPNVRPSFYPEFSADRGLEFRQCFVEQQALTGYDWPFVPHGCIEAADAGSAGAIVEAIVGCEEGELGALPYFDD